MKIEKLEIKTEYDFDFDKELLKFPHHKVLNKINELIDQTNENTKLIEETAKLGSECMKLLTEHIALILEVPGVSE
jgi:hypothetical protein